MSKPVLSYKQLPVRGPLHLSVTLWLLTDYTHAPGWVCGVAGALVALLWIVFFVALYQQTQIELDALSEDRGKRLRAGQST